MLASTYINDLVVERFRSVLIKTRFPVSGAFSGIHRSLLKGSAMEFAELRDYYPGDDLRRLDWKAYGRSDKFFLKEYESETNARVYFLLDTSGSMNFMGAHGVSRVLFSQQLIATLSSLFLYQSDAVGLAHFHNGEMVTPLYRGESSLPRVLEELGKVSANGETMLSSQMHALAERIPRRSLVLILSDFFTRLPPLTQALQHLAHYAHEVSLIQVISSQEQDLPASGRTVYKDLESSFILNTNPEVIREEYRSSLESHLSALSTLAVQNRAAHFLVQLEQGVERAINSFLKPHLD